MFYRSSSCVPRSRSPTTSRLGMSSPPFPMTRPARTHSRYGRLHHAEFLFFFLRMSFCSSLFFFLFFGFFYFIKQDIFLVFEVRQIISKFMSILISGINKSCPINAAKAHHDADISFELLEDDLKCLAKEEFADIIIDN